MLADSVAVCFNSRRQSDKVSGSSLFVNETWQLLKIAGDSRRTGDGRKAGGGMSSEKMKVIHLLVKIIHLLVKIFHPLGDRSSLDSGR